MNPLSEERRRYQYVGEITKTGKFFFEVQLGAGEYICLMETNFKYDSEPHFSIFSEHPISISGSNLHRGFSKESRCKDQNKSIVSKKSKKMIRESDSLSAPKEIIAKKAFAERKVNLSQFSKRSLKEVRIKKDFLVKDDFEEKENEV